MKALNVFVATLNESALMKFKEAGVRPPWRQLVFFEEALNTASMFFRLYVRNLHAIELRKADFSLYEQPPIQPSMLGFLGDPNEIPKVIANPGQAFGPGLAQGPSR